jgi:hypothetical protein
MCGCSQQPYFPPPPAYQAPQPIQQATGLENAEIPEPVFVESMEE